MTALLSVPKLEPIAKNFEEAVLQDRTLSALKGTSFAAILLVFYTSETIMLLCNVNYNLINIFLHASLKIERH